MYFYFDQTDDEDQTFQDKDGNFFYHRIEVGSNPGGVDDIMIEDTCGRATYVSTDAIPELIKALGLAHMTASAVNSLSDFENNVFSKDYSVSITEE